MLRLSDMSDPKPGISLTNGHFMCTVAETEMKQVSGAVQMLLLEEKMIPY